MSRRKQFGGGRARVELMRVMTRSQGLQLAVIIAGWLAANCWFWIWWLRGEHWGNVMLFVLMSGAFLYEASVLPSFYMFYLANMRRPKHIPARAAKRAGVVKRVAMITLTVPGSEAIEIVRRQLEAMVAVRYPHDSWILVDKVHSPEIKALAERLGVRYFSRHDVETWGAEQVARWNQPVPPFKQKTKAGNVNAWLDAFGRNYSHFTQLDIDHVPVPTYLHRVLGYFLDAKVAWVQAPSVYGNSHLWTARGSSEQELVLQGPLQMGFFGFCRTPFIIGSHCTYDTQAILDIGGFQPTRAEDHLDTVFLAAAGREGVFVDEVIAVGDGPENFDTYLAQQFAWAFSMIQVLFTFTPKCIKHYTKRQAIQFIFVQTWYTLWSVSMLLLFALPVLALLLNESIAHANFFQFTLHSLPLGAIAFGAWFWSRKWQLPKRIGLSWRGVVLHVGRWPVVLSALIQVILGVEKPYMITVKGIHKGEASPFSIKPHMPYFSLIGASFAACWVNLLVFGRGTPQGYLMFALQGATIIFTVYCTALLRDIGNLIEDGVALLRAMKLRAMPIMVMLIIAGMLAVTVYASIGRIIEALS